MDGLSSAHKKRGGGGRQSNYIEVIRCVAQIVVCVQWAYPNATPFNHSVAIVIKYMYHWTHLPPHRWPPAPRPRWPPARHPARSAVLAFRPQCSFCHRALHSKLQLARKRCPPSHHVQLSRCCCSACSAAAAPSWPTKVRCPHTCVLFLLLWLQWIGLISRPVCP